MDYLSTFDISGSGMSIQKARLDTVALNLANVSTTRGLNGGPYKRKEVITAEKPLLDFNSHLTNSAAIQMTGVEIIEIRELDEAPVKIFEPAHPDADKKGFVAYPRINTASEMMILISATRAYEANIKAMVAAKTMAIKALEIGN